MSKPRKKSKDTKDMKDMKDKTPTPAEERVEPVVDMPTVGESIEEDVPEAVEDPQADSSTEEEVEQDLMEVLRTERDAFQEKWLRAVAEMENVRKRARRDVQNSRRFAQADILRPLLEVHDNFERALQALPVDEDTTGGSGIREGIDLIFQKFRSVLKDKGVEPILALDTEFDTKVHEAVGQVEREGVEAGIVIEVVQTGFLLGGDFVLRPARVIIAG